MLGRLLVKRTLQFPDSPAQNAWMEHKRKNPKHAGVELDIYDDPDNRHSIYLVSRPQGLRYEVASGVPVTDLGNGVFQLPGHYSKIRRMRPKT
jgi:hypothetical protein